MMAENSKKMGLNFKTWRDADYVPHPDEYKQMDVFNILKEGSIGPRQQEACQQAFNKAPRDLTRLVSIADKIDGDATKVEYGVEQGSDAKVFMALKNLQPGGLNLIVVNGEIRVPQQILSPDKYKALAHFCWMNGLQIDIPSDVDEEFRSKFEKAEEEREQVGRQDETAREIDSEIQAANDPEAQNDLAALEQGKEVKKKAAEAKNPDLKKVDAAMKTFMNRLGKNEDKTFFRDYSFRGELVYRLYAKDGDRKNDGKTEKGRKSNTYEIEIRFREERNGGMSVRYGTPENKAVDISYADEMVGILKGQGFTSIRFEMPLTDGDKGKFREACGRAGVIPEGFNLNEHHVKKMMNFAAEALSPKDLLDYKRRMAARLRRQLIEQNIDFNSVDNRLRNTIVGFEEEVRDTPVDHRYISFKQAYDGIKKDIHDRANKRGAETGRADAAEVIGSAKAFVEFYGVYKNFCDKPVSELIADAAVFNLPEEREQFLTATGLKKDDKTRVMDLGQDKLVILYKCMIEEQQNDATNLLSEQFNRPDRDSDNEIIKTAVKDATDSMRDVAWDLESNGGGKIYVESLGTPIYQGARAPRNNKRNNNNFHQRDSR